MKSIATGIILIIILGFITSCAGAPPPPVETPVAKQEAPAKAPEPAPTPEPAKESGAQEADAAKKAADAARERADTQKAAVAAKEEYATAVAAYQKAEEELKASRYAEALAGFGVAEAGFDASAKLASDRRLAAEAAMKKADESIKTTDDRFKVIESELTEEEGGEE